MSLGGTAPCDDRVLMPKASLYARGSSALTVAGVILALGAVIRSAPASRQNGVPCAQCIVLAGTVEQSGVVTDTLHGVEFIVYLPAEAVDLRPAIERIREFHGVPGVWIRGMDPRATGLDPTVLTGRIIVDVSAETAVSDEFVFRLKTYLTSLRSAGQSLQLGVYAGPGVLAGLRQRGVGAYVDFVGQNAAVTPPFPVPAGPAAGAVSLHPSGEPDAAPERWIVPLPADAEAAARLLLDVAGSASVLREGLIAGGMVDVRCAGRALPTFLNPESLDTVALVPGCREGQLTVAPASSEATRLVLSSGHMVVRVPAPEGRFAQGVDVRATRKLSVREIVARHQAAAARQRRHIGQLISTGRMTLTFEAPGFPAPMTITTATTIYSDRVAVDVEQRDIRVNGLALSADRVPRLPLLEPERVAAVPLAIALTDVYRYSLDGQESVSGVSCYVVKFEPIDSRQSLFAGRAWIAQDGFAMVKVVAVQTGLRGPIVSSEQSDEFRPEAAGVWLLARSDVRQIYEGAGHRTPIRRLLIIDRHEINPSAFSARREAAYASPSIMLRDTAEGFRYLRRERTSAAPGQPAMVTTEEAAERVRTLALGVILDPNISRPLPFAGLSYVDFDLFGTGTQMNGFFGGSFGQLAVAVPSVGRTRWQLGGRAFGIASSYNDRAFIDGREDYEANISQRPAHASAWLLRPLTTRVTVRAVYEFDYTAYGRVSSTAASFLVPASQRAHGLRLGLDGQWARWSASVWWAGARRAGWREWGADGGEYDARHGGYQRFGATLARAFVPSPRLVARVEAAWMSGRDLDRFSRYSFGGFDNRLRGYPSALIRYDRGGVVRAAGAWAAGRRLRIDAFLDTAYVRDPNFGSRASSYTGVGAAIEVPAPFGTLAAVEWGYGFQGIDAEGRRGTHVVRVSGYKMF